MDPWVGWDVPLFTHGSNVVPKDRGVEEGVGIFFVLRNPQEQV